MKCERCDDDSGGPMYPLTMPVTEPDGRRRLVRRVICRGCVTELSAWWYLRPMVERVDALRQ